MVIVNGAAISWVSRKQSVISLSSTEAEFYSMTLAMKEILWLRNLLGEVGIDIPNGSVLYQDNLSKMAIANNPINHGETKHMDIRYSFIREKLSSGTVKLVHVNTENMVADILTKALPYKQHARLTSVVYIGHRMIPVFSGESLC